MKTFFMKVFLIIASAMCLLEGLVLVAVGLNQLSSERLLSFYSRLLTAPKSLSTILGIGVFFMMLGFILLVVSSRTRPAPKMISVEKDGKALRIPQETIKGFIKQIVEQNPFASDISVDFETKDELTTIRLACAFNAVDSVHQEVNRIEEVLKNEIESVFEWKDFQFTFQLRGVGVDPKKKYFSSSEAEAELAIAEKVDAADEELASEDEPEAKAKEKNKAKPKDKNLISKMLFGK